MGQRRERIQVTGFVQRQFTQNVEQVSRFYRRTVRDPKVIAAARASPDRKPLRDVQLHRKRSSPELIQDSRMVRLPVTGGVAVNAHYDFPRPLPGKQLPMTSHAEGSPARQNFDNAKQRKPVRILSSLVSRP